MTGVYHSIRQRLADSLPAGSLRARMAHGALWSLMGGVATQGTNTLVAIAAGRMLGKAGFGELGMIRNTLAVFSTFATLGLAMMASKYVAELRGKDPDRAGRVAGVCYTVAWAAGLLAAGLLAAFAHPLASGTLRAPHLGPLLIISAPALAFGAVNAVQTGVLTGFEAFRALSLCSLCVAAGSGALTVLGITVAGLAGAMWAGVIAGCVGNAVYALLVRAECRRHGVRIVYGLPAAERHALLHFAAPALLAGLTVAPVTWAAHAILVNAPGGYAEMGVLNAANQWRALLLFIPQIVSAPLMPIMSQLQSQGNWATLRRVANRWMLGNVALVLAACVPLAIISRQAMGLFGPGFSSGAAVMLLMLAVAVFLAAGAVVGHLMVSTGRMWFGLGANVVWGAALIALSAALSPRYGALGLALAYLISYGLHTVIQVTYYQFARIAPRASDGAPPPPPRPTLDG